MTEAHPDADAGASRDAEVAIDTDVVRELAGILRESDLTSIEVERGPLRIRVARETQAAGVSMAGPVAPAATPAPATNIAPPGAAPPPLAGELVKSPMVGTVYLQAQPGAEPFVRVGDRVDAGQTVVIIEAMKTMNPVAAPRAGVLVELLIGDGQPVEYGQPLAVVA